MHFKLSPLAAGLCLLGVMSVPVFAAETTTTASQEEIIRKLNERTIALESELKVLRGEISQLKTTKVRKATPVAEQPKVATRGKVFAKSSSVAAAAQRLQAAQVPQTGMMFEEQASIATAQPQLEPLYFLSKTPMYLGGAPVVTSPMIGLRSEADIGDLIVNMPSVNEDLRILKQRQELIGLYNKFGLPVPTQPIIDLSGRVEGQILSEKPFGSARTNDTDLSGAELDIAALVSPWATGLIAIVYDNNPPAPGTGRHVDNSRVRVDKGFVMIGDLTQSPFYGTLGQFFVPFGQYGSFMVSSPLTQFVGRIKARAALLGYNQSLGSVGAFNGSIVGFRGDSIVGGTSTVNNYAVNLDYTFGHSKLSGDVAVSYVANIADAQGMQNNGGATGFTGFATTNTTSQHIAKRIPGVDLRGSIGYGDFSFLGEYVTATQAFSNTDMTYNNHGARPGAFHIEGVYNFNILGKKSLVALGYDQTQNALALLLPKQRYAATLSTSIWQYTIQSLEYRHDINYSNGNVATGAQGIAVQPSGLGSTSDNVTLQIGIYF